MNTHYLPSGKAVTESELNRWVETGRFTPDDTGVVKATAVVASLEVNGVMVVEGSHGAAVEVES